MKKNALLSLALLCVFQTNVTSAMSNSSIASVEKKVRAEDAPSFTVNNHWRPEEHLNTGVSIEKIAYDPPLQKIVFSHHYGDGNAFTSISLKNSTPAHCDLYPKRLYGTHQVMGQWYHFGEGQIIHPECRHRENLPLCAPNYQTSLTTDGQSYYGIRTTNERKQIVEQFSIDFANNKVKNTQTLVDLGIPSDYDSRYTDLAVTKNNLIVTNNAHVVAINKLNGNIEHEWTSDISDEDIKLTTIHGHDSVYFSHKNKIYHFDIQAKKTTPLIELPDTIDSIAATENNALVCGHAHQKLTFVDLATKKTIVKQFEQPACTWQFPTCKITAINTIENGGALALALSCTDLMIARNPLLQARYNQKAAEDRQKFAAILKVIKTSDSFDGLEPHERNDAKVATIIEEYLDTDMRTAIQQINLQSQTRPSVASSTNCSTSSSSSSSSTTATTAVADTNKEKQPSRCCIM